MNDLINLVKTYAPALATALAGPAGGAVVSAIASKLGVSADVATITQALAQDPQAAQKLAEINLEQFKVEENNITARWVADDAAESWLTKNIRPLTLVYILTSYIVLALLDGGGFKVAESYVNLLGQWGQLVMLAYFGGKTIERVMKK